MEGLAGEITIEVKVTLPPVTVILAELVKAPDWAATSTLPIATPVTTPAALTVAVFESAELQVTTEVKSFVEPSEYKPKAWSGVVAAAAIDVAFGLTKRPLSVAGTGCPPDADWPPELGWFLTPLQAARYTHNERTAILRRTNFLRRVQSRLNRIYMLFGTDTNHRFAACENGWYSDLRYGSV
jgi:hypothetical protein